MDIQCVMTSLQDLTGLNNLFDSYTGYYDETSRVRNTSLMNIQCE